MSAYQITLITTDNQTLSFTGNDSQDIITAAQEQEIYLVAQCHSGSCGACNGKLVSGHINHTDYSKDALPQAQRKQGQGEQGQVLLCCSKPKEDVTIHLPYAYSAIQFEKKPQRHATIVAKTYLTPNTIKLDCQLLPDADDTLILDFEPGQFMALHLPHPKTSGNSDANNNANNNAKNVPTTNEPITRAYSIANAPNWEGRLEFLIKLCEGGKFSTFLQQTAVVGMQLTLDGPMGTFMLQDNGLRPRYFVAGGCGLASVMSMLRRMAEWQEPHPVKLFFGVWDEQAVFFEQQIAELACEYPQLDYQICVTNASTSWTAGKQDNHHYAGSVVDAFDTAMDKAMQAKTATPDVYICGSSNLIEAVANTAEKHGIKRDALIYERYLANEQPHKATRCDVLN